MRNYNLLHAAAFKLRGAAMVPPLVFIGLWFRWEWENEAIAWPLGLLVFGAGMALRIWSQKHLRYRLPGDRELATTGPYAWVRNPVYLGNLGLFAGLCILCELVWAVPLVCGWAALLYHWAVQFEEFRLVHRYADAYITYRDAVPRWLPAPSRVAERTRGKLDALGASFRVEWHCVLLLAIPAAKECIARFVLAGS